MPLHASKWQMLSSAADSATTCTNSSQLTNKRGKNTKYHNKQHIWAVLDKKSDDNYNRHCAPRPLNWSHVNSLGHAHQHARRSSFCVRMLRPVVSSHWANADASKEWIIFNAACRFFRCASASNRAISYQCLNAPPRAPYITFANARIVLCSTRSLSHASVRHVRNMICAFPSILFCKSIITLWALI